MPRLTWARFFNVMAVATALKAFALELTARSTTTARTFCNDLCRETDVERICSATALSKGSVFGDQRAVPAARWPSSACTLAHVKASAAGVDRAAGWILAVGAWLPEEHEQAKTRASTSALTLRQARLFLDIDDPRSDVETPTLPPDPCANLGPAGRSRATRRSAPARSCTPARSRRVARASCRRGRRRARRRRRRAA